MEPPSLLAGLNFTQALIRTRIAVKRPRIGRKLDPQTLTDPRRSPSIPADSAESRWKLLGRAGGIAADDDHVPWLARRDHPDAVSRHVTARAFQCPGTVFGPKARLWGRLGRGRLDSRGAGKQATDRVCNARISSDQFAGKDASMKANVPMSRVKSKVTTIEF